MNVRVLLTLVIILFLVSVTPGGSQAGSALHGGLMTPTPTFPMERSRITVDNVDQVAQLNALGLTTPYDLAWSPDGEKLAIASSTGVWVYNIVSLQPPLHLTESHSSNVAFSPTQDLLASMSSGSNEMQLWDVSTGTLQTVLHGRNLLLYSIRFGPDGTHLVSTSWDNTIRLWDISTGEIVAVYEGHTDVALVVGFTPDGALLISVADGWDHTIRLWDTLTGESLAIQPIFTVDNVREGLCGAALNPDSRLAALATCTGEIRIWDVEAGEELGILRGHTDPVRSLAFNADGTLLVSGDEIGEIRIWDIEAGEELGIFRGHTDPVRSLAFNADGTLLASADPESTVRLWGTLQP